MTITTAEYKAAIEAKIAAATGATTLKDLTLIKTNADLWLLNNEGGSITDYASLEALIQDKQDDLDGSSTLNDVSFVGISAFPPQESDGAVGYKNKATITTSGTWTVPAGVYQIGLVGVGGGGAGMGSNSGSGTVSGGGGGGAASQFRTAVDVRPGDVLAIVIGAGGLGVVNAAGSAGGLTSVAIGQLPVAVSSGGNNAITSSGGSVTTTAGLSTEEIRGGIGGGGIGTGFVGVVGGKATLRTSNTTSHTQTIAALPTTVAGAAGSVGGAGGGGGSSAYGVGGNGADGTNTSTPNAGGDAPSTSYGAGGGGASGTVSATTVKGGNGANGIVEIYY